MQFEIILPVKLKNMKIHELIDVIDSIQSFNYDWGSYVMTITEDLVEYKESEKITPIPTNVGAIDFTEYIYDEEMLLKCLKRYIKSEKFRKLKRFIELGYKISKFINEDLLEELIYSNKDIITSVHTEIFITLKSETLMRTKEIIKDTPFNNYELIRASYYYLQPNDVYNALEESYYLIDYLNKLIKLIENSSVEEEGVLLILRGYYSAKKTMLDLEREVRKVVKKLKDIVEYKTLMFNRIL